jgi:sensor histidine kinase YesM
MVPALIIQPFIENAIWHGIVPRGEGNVTITIKGNNDTIICKVNDDGIGRERSKLNKSASPILHESKGVFLSQARLNLGKLLNDMDATIETIDKHENGKACGTIVTFTFKLN